MRLRNLVAATAASALTIGLAGAFSAPVHAVTVPSAANAGTVVTWGDEDDPNGGAAIPVPGDLTGPVTSVAANQNATGVVTLAGAVRVWGNAMAPEVTEVPPGLTNASAIALTTNNGAVLHTDGHVSAWGDSTELSEVPSDLRAKAIALQSGTGYAVRPNGTLATWGDTPAYPLPETGLSDLVDVAVSLTHVLVLHANGTVTIWGAELPGLLEVPDFGGKKAAKIAAGFGYSGVIFEDGSVDLWGFGPMMPTDEPTFDGLTPAGKAISLSLASNAAAVTADGAVHAWGPNTLVTTVPAALTGQPVSAAAVGTTHVAAIVTTFRDLTKPTITGTPVVGQTLTATPATFSLTPDAPATGQWYAGSDPIADKTTTTLALTAAQVAKSISYRTTATRSGTTITSASTTLGPVAAAPTPPATKAKSTVTAKIKATGKTKKIAKKVTITVTVKTTKGISPAGKVTITLKGKTKKNVTANVNAKGVAKVTIKKVKRGTYTAQLTYAGNTKVAPSKATTKKTKI
jgi:hypothetical protein